jgi:putative Ca2+/H+ antiporter (TMEM165/GDT1 family)
MKPTKNSNGSSGRVLERIVGIAGGAILAGSLAVMIFNALDRQLPNELISVIAGAAGGLVASLQRLWNKRKQLGEKE